MKKNNYNIITFSENRSTMIPICKWIPPIFDKYILNKKLLKLYWSGKHDIVNPTT